MSLLVSKQNINDDKEVDFRPDRMQHYYGQEKIIKNLRIMLESAKLRNKTLDHILFSGPPGLGKTTLAYLISHEMGGDLKVLSGPAVERKGELAAILTNLDRGSILFLDEIHRIPLPVEELLYSAMEDYRLDILLGQGPTARVMKIDLPQFTLIGATTKSGNLSNPLRDRFLAHFNLNYYTEEALIKIIEENGRKLEISMTYNVKRHIAFCSRGTPRIALRILRRLRDFACVKAIQKITEKVLLEALSLMGVDKLGLNEMDRKILNAISKFYDGGPVGIEAIAATLGEERNTLEEVYEPFLVKQGFLLRTARGRVLSDYGLKMLESMRDK